MGSPRSCANRPVSLQPIQTTTLTPDEGVGTEPLTVVAIGASAGGLDTFRRFLDALPAGSGMAFILVQHLDPTHPSMLVELLTGRGPLTALEAVDGLSLEPEHLYVIPPGAYLTVAVGSLHLSQPDEHRGARLAFDALLRSLAESYGDRAVCVVLSGTGSDGSLGLGAIKARGGWVIAQDPTDAAFEGMPKSAIATGLVDLVLPADEIPDALIKGRERAARPRGPPIADEEGANDLLTQIIDLLRAHTAHDFRSYKPGTLSRRIARRMAMAAIPTGRMDLYLRHLDGDADELRLLATDMLINITSFFRDPEVFERLERTAFSELIAKHPVDRPLRVWTAGCSTGEETYSVAMLLREQMVAQNRDITLQIFASDLDPDAVAIAREGLYPESIVAQVSPARLARFFIREDQSYRVTPALRAAVVFTVQDVLADPPFSRLDLISCRNLLIYLSADAQTKVLSRFHFALAPGGLLLLGSAETTGTVAEQFEIVAKSERLYRRIGKGRTTDLELSGGALPIARSPSHPASRVGPARETTLAELCRRLVVDAYAPAAVLINLRHECLFSLGPTDRYLRVPPGRATADLLAMARPGLAAELRSTIRLAVEGAARVIAPGGCTDRDGNAVCFDIAVEPVSSEGESFLLVCFVDAAEPQRERAGVATPHDPDAVAALERELAATKNELRSALSNLEISSEEQSAINAEAQSVNEEFQSTNEELLTSKEELQSLNEELTALNTQLQETLERQRVTSNDLQNVLYSTDVATLFLDTELRIRFFTPATKSLFNILASDVGRPLADLHSLAADGDVTVDARAVLHGSNPIEREIESEQGAWFVRRILPYRTHDNLVEGVVILFADVTERKNAARALECAKKDADVANVVKSKFLAAASHDLRQPLQSLVFLQGLLAQSVNGEAEQELVQRFDQTLGAMSGMLNSLLDINQIEAGVVRPEVVAFPVGDLLDRMRDEFTYHAQAQGLSLDVIACSRLVTSDPRLLEQMLRNLISNALKYTPTGRVLVGCRRHDGFVSIEVWDTGIGISAEDHRAIFEEYHQVDNVARERSRGIGLGLSIVQRLGDLLDHRVRVLSRPGNGSVFAIQAPTPHRQVKPTGGLDEETWVEESAPVRRRKGKIVVVEDDPEVRELLALLLKDAGHHVVTAPDGATALDLITSGALRPDIILADYNLPNSITGLELVVSIRDRFENDIPAIVLTGDISTDTLRDIALQNCVQLNKPVKLPHLAQLVQDLLPIRPEGAGSTGRRADPGRDTFDPVIFVIDDNMQVREGIRSLLEDVGRTVQDYATAEAFLEAYDPAQAGCLLVDACLPGMSGMDLLERLHAQGHQAPAIIITGKSDVSIAVQAMKAGAMDFVEKPIAATDLLAIIDLALEHSRDTSKWLAWQADAGQRLAGLTPRQHEVLDRVLAGQPSKNIAADLGISQRTVETHRASIMKKTGSKSLPALARVALAAAAGAPGVAHPV